MNRNRFYILIVAFGMLAISACSNTKNLPEGESLFLGGKVNIQDDAADKRHRKVLAGDLKGAIRPKPNTNILGIRLKLTAWNMAGDTSKKGFLRKILRNSGEPPVLTSQFDMEKNQKLFVNIMENRGFFYPTVKGELKTRNKKSRVNFDVWTGPQYKVRNIIYVDDGSMVSQDVAKLQDSSLLKSESPYNLDLIKGERDRIDKKLKEIGYYYFSPNYILVQVDSSVGENKVDLFVKVKDDMPVDAGEKYYINRVFIYPNYRLERGRRLGRQDSTRSMVRRARRRGVNDTLYYERYYIIGNTKMFKPYVFTQAMQFYPGDAYNRTDQNMALNRLINMGNFKFVKNEFEDIGEGLLDVRYQLTPLPKKSLRAEFGSYTKNDSRVGSEVNFTWRNRNAFRGAELFSIRANVGSEIQGSGNNKRPSTYQFGLFPTVTIPRFVIPFIEVTPSSMFVPRTIIRTGYQVQLRQDLYALQSITAGYGYQWKENIKTEHQLFPINITYVKTDTLNKDTTFNINFSNLVFDGLIIGPTYEYTFTSRVTGAPNKHDFYFNGLADLSGNILGLAQGANLQDTRADARKTIFGAEYAQYLKFQTDFRHYLNYGPNPNSILASRLILGVGYPYGNSLMLPNIKQFFSGGNSSLRGFPSRLVGPGTFYEDPENRTFIETSGDMKLEINTELRAQLYQFVHGAIFLDAGNIWTVRDTSLFGQRGLFKADRFLSELAINTGIGLRLDFKILVLRLDLGIPIHKPWVTEGNKWAFNFKKENMILNLGIGYPF